jgi:hypothetical protein
VIRRCAPASALRMPKPPAWALLRCLSAICGSGATDLVSCQARGPNPRGPHQEEAARSRPVATNPGRAPRRPGGDAGDVGAGPCEPLGPELRGDRPIPRLQPGAGRQQPGRSVACPPTSPWPLASRVGGVAWTRRRNHH